MRLENRTSNRDDEFFRRRDDEFQFFFFLSRDDEFQFEFEFDLFEFDVIEEIFRFEGKGI